MELAHCITSSYTCQVKSRILLGGARMARKSKVWEFAVDLFWGAGSVLLGVSVVVGLTCLAFAAIVFMTRMAGLSL